MKLNINAVPVDYQVSRPSRGAWIETLKVIRDDWDVVSRPSRGAWIET